MTEETASRRHRQVPEPASATSVILLSLATFGCGIGAILWQHTPLALCALVVGYYVLHLLGLRRAAREAVVAHSAEAQRIALLREQEFERQLRDVALMEPELEKERVRVEQQWQHLKGLVDERESRKRTLREYEASLEAVREEAAAALEAARLEVRARETSESLLRERIAELEADRAKAVGALRKVIAAQSGKQTRFSAQEKARTVVEGAEEKARAVVAGAEETARALVAEAETKLESARVEEQQQLRARQELNRQIEELEESRTEASKALQQVAERRLELRANRKTDEAPRTGIIRPETPRAAYAGRPARVERSAHGKPGLRAWQFIAHKRSLARRDD